MKKILIISVLFAAAIVFSGCSDGSGNLNQNDNTNKNGDSNTTGKIIPENPFPADSVLADITIDAQRSDIGDGEWKIICMEYIAGLAVGLNENDLKRINSLELSDSERTKVNSWIRENDDGVTLLDLPYETIVQVDTFKVSINNGEYEIKEGTDFFQATIKPENELIKKVRPYELYYWDEYTFTKTRDLSKSDSDWTRFENWFKTTAFSYKLKTNDEKTKFYQNNITYQYYLEKQ